MESQEQSIDVNEARRLLFDEWKFRHHVFWSLYFRWGAGIIAISVIPYIRRELVSDLRGVVIGPWINGSIPAFSAINIFPLLAAVFAIVAGLHLGAEYSRLEAVRTRYISSLAAFQPPPVFWLFSWRVGIAAYLVFILAFLLLSYVNWAILGQIR